MRNLYYFLLAFVVTVAVGINSARAETINATATQVAINNSHLQKTPIVSSVSSFIDQNQDCQEILQLETSSCIQSKSITSCTYSSTGGTLNPGGSYTLVNSSGACGGGTVTKNFVTSFNTGCPSGTSWNGTDCYTTVYSCPANQGWTLSGTTCTRVDCPYGRDANGNCKGQCDGKANQTAAPSTYYVAPPSIACYNGCVAKRYMDLDSGSPAYDVVQNGVIVPWTRFIYYYEGDGTSSGAGVSCSAVSTTLASSSPPTGNSAPQNMTQTCAQGQTGGYVNGKFTCVNQTTGQQTAQGGPTQPTQSTAKSTVTNADGSTTTTETTTYSDGSKTVVKSTTASGGGTSTTSSQSFDANGKPVSGTVPGGGGTSGTTANDVKQGTKDAITDYCTQNPSSPICKETTSGNAANIDGLYTKASGDKTFSSVMQSFRSSVQAAPFFQAATGYFNFSIGSGSCSGLDGTVSVSVSGASGTIGIYQGDTLCGSTAMGLYTLLSIGVLLGASWVAFRIAFL